MGQFKNLERVAMKELETLNAKYEGKNEFSKEDLELFKCLTVGWEKLLKGEQLHKEAEEMEMGGVSYRSQPRNMYNGQYMSREMGDGWSGHYPGNYYNAPSWMDRPGRP